MFDISFGELAIIGIVALVVIGPEKLPKVARTAGALVGRLQRYVNDVKSEIQRETSMAELRQLGGEVTSAAESLRNTIQKEASEAENAIRSAGDEAAAAIGEARAAVEPAAAVVQEAHAAVADPLADVRPDDVQVDDSQLDLFADTHPPVPQPAAAAAKPAESA